MKGVFSSLAVALFAVLTGLSPVRAADKSNRPYDVTMTGYVVMPSGRSMPTGQDVQLREHDILFKGSLAWFSVTRLATSVTVHALDLDFVIPAGAPLKLAAGYTGGDMGTLGDSARVFCEEPKHDMVKAWAQLATLGLSSLGSRLARDTRTCLVDSDGDLKFDKGFIVGLKKPEDRHMVPIDPVAYEIRMIEPIEGDSRLEVEFLDGGALSGPNFELKMIVDGKEENFAALHFFSLDGIASRFRSARWSPLKLKKLPMAFRFGGAEVTVKSFDPVSKVASATIYHDFSLNGFVVEPVPQTIYIYY